jgi:carbonic anhydrase
MKKLPQLIEANKKWVASMLDQDPKFFDRLANQQSPKYLWIGCSDSRVPANQITGLDPGEMFVHRNIANVIVHTDLNCLSVIQYAVEVLKVTDIIVCGHYGCGGVAASLSSQSFGLIDNWIRNIKDIYLMHKEEVEAIKDQKERVNRLCELNVKEQVANLTHTTIVQEAWKRGQNLNVHGWIYDIRDGYIKDLDIAVTNSDQINDIFRMEK